MASNNPTVNIEPRFTAGAPKISSARTSGAGQAPKVNQGLHTSKGSGNGRYKISNFDFPKDAPVSCPQSTRNNALSYDKENPLQLNTRPDTLASYTLFRKQMSPKSSPHAEIQTILRTTNHPNHRKNSHQPQRTDFATKPLELNLHRIQVGQGHKQTSPAEYNFQGAVQGKVMGPSSYRSEAETKSTIGRYRSKDNEKETNTYKNPLMFPSARNTKQLPPVSSHAASHVHETYGITPRSRNTKKNSKTTGILSRKSNILENRKGFVRVSRHDRDNQLQKDLSDCFKPIVDNENTKFLLNIDLIYKNNKMFNLK